MPKMSLQTILEGMPDESKLSFLRKAYLPERTDVAEALLGELEIKLRAGSDFYRKDDRTEFNRVITTLIRNADESGDRNKAAELRFQWITSHFFARDIELAAKSTENPVLIEKTIEHYRKEYFNKAEMVINLLNHVGRHEEAREYSLEAAKALRTSNSSIRSFMAVEIYSHLGMFKEAIEVQLDNQDFNEAIKFAQEHLREEELPPFYRRVFNASKGKGYDYGFPFQVKATGLLGDKSLEMATKKAYVDWVMTATDDYDGEKVGYLDLLREAGTKEQLVEMHRRIVAFYQQGYVGWSGCSGVTHWARLKPKDLAEAAEEAYKDTLQANYAVIAMNAYKKAENFPKALEFARIAEPQKAHLLEEMVALL